MGAFKGVTSSAGGVLADLSPSPGARTFRAELSTASLFVDLDGTLVEFEDDPAAVRAKPEVLQTLSSGQARLGGRLAILSGRSIASIDEVVRAHVPTVAGVHGLQRRVAGADVVETAAHPALDQVAETLDAFARADGQLRVERKGQSVAIHFRQAPAVGPAVVELVERLAKSTDLQVQHGVLVAEVRTPGPDKGTALRTFMNLEPFAGTRPIFIGDDLTDEPAFVAAQALGGVGLAVGGGRETAAFGRLRDPSAVLSWIRESLDQGAFTVTMSD
jgi:trehalose 6-phosphate phosphatase